MIVVDPSLEDVVRRVCDIIGQNPAELEARVIAELECQTAGRLTFVKARAEGLKAEQLRELL